MFESGSYKFLPKHVALYEALEASMARANREEFLTEKDKSRKRGRDDQDPHPLLGSNPSKRRRHDSGRLGSSRKQSASHSKQPIEDVPITDNVNVSDSEDTDTTYLSKLKTRPDWIKPVPKKTFQQLQNQTGLFLLMSCLKLRTIRLTHLPARRQIVPDISKPLHLGGPLGQVTIQSQYFFYKDMEYLVSGDKGRISALSLSKLSSLWIESEREYDISATYGISHLWFKCKEFYITRHDAPLVAVKSDHTCGFLMSSVLRFM
nr:hypothetical protein [Tanacetum cinerariifolium]